MKHDPTGELGWWRSIYGRLRDSPEWAELEADARLVFYTLKLNPSPSGIDHYHFAGQGEWHTGLPLERIERAAAELEAEGWIEVERPLVWIVDSLAYDPAWKMSNARHRKALETHIRSLPRLPIVGRFIIRYVDWFDDAADLVEWAQRRVRNP